MTRLILHAGYRVLVLHALCVCVSVTGRDKDDNEIQGSGLRAKQSSIVV